ncbi:MAG: immunoglobulin domain-containing protein [Phycisphaeraceae bacterium]|nr:MAG: immunoglobulin domain-containing protein [Phycisphaeraceae bacterium]
MLFSTLWESLRPLASVGTRVMGLAAAVTLAVSPQARAQCSGEFSGVGVAGISGNGFGWVTGWDPDGAGPTPELMIVGGNFKLADNVLVSSLASWQPDPNLINPFGLWAPFAGGVYLGTAPGRVQTMQPVGTQLIVAGEFTRVGGLAPQGLAANNIARYDGPTGVWIPYHTGTNGAVFAASLWNGQLFIGGGFTQASGTVVNGISRWDGTRWRAFGRHVADPDTDPPTYAPGLPGTVTSIAVLNNVLYAAGVFAFPGGNELHPLVRYDAVANEWFPVGTQWAPQNPLIPWPVGWSLHSAGGLLYVGGTFTGVNSGTASGIVRFNGNAFLPMNGGVFKFFGVPTVYSITLSPANEILIGGDFEFAGVSMPVSARNFVRWTGTQYLAPANGGTLGPVASVGIFRNQAAVMGPIRRIGDTWMSNISWFDGTVWRRLGQGFNGAIFAMRRFNDRLVAAGSFFRTQFQVQAAGIASYDGELWTTVGLGMTYGGGTPGIYDLAEHQNRLIAVGEFDASGNEFMSNIAEWNGTAWRAKGFVDGPVFAVGSLNNQMLFIGGDLPSYGNLAEFDGFGWSAVTFGTEAPVWAITEYQGRLIAGGDFELAGGIGCTRVLQWDPVTEIFGPMSTGFTKNPPPNPDNPATVRTLKVIDGVLYAGGDFNRSGARVVNNIARWDGTQWQPLGNGPGFNVWTISKLGDYLYAGGIGGANAAYWDGTTWRNMRAGTDGPVYAMETLNGKLHLGGTFLTADNTPASYFAKWTPSFNVSITQHPQGTLLCPGSNYQMSVTATGTGPFTYQWRRNGQPIDGAVNRTYTVTGANAGSAGSYTVLVSNGCSEQISNAAVLTICAVDFNCDGFLDFFDLLDYLGAFEEGLPGGDFNGDGFIDFFDFLDFTDGFEAGC